MHNCQQYIKFLWKSRKKVKIFGDNLPDHITIDNCAFFVVTMFILLIHVIPTESVTESRMCNFSSTKKRESGTIYHEQHFNESSLILCCMMKNIRNIKENREADKLDHRYRSFDKKLNLYRSVKLNKNCCCDIEKCDKIQKHNLEAHQNLRPYEDESVHVSETSLFHLQYRKCIFLLHKICIFSKFFPRRRKRHDIVSATRMQINKIENENSANNNDM